jgi:hypothetical protein
MNRKGKEMVCKWQIGPKQMARVAFISVNRLMKLSEIDQKVVKIGQKKFHELISRTFPLDLPPWERGGSAKSR